MVSPVKLMQYMRYLDINMLHRLDSFATSQGRNLISMKSGIRASAAMMSTFAPKALPSMFASHGLHSSFLINYFENFTSILLGVFFGLLFTFLQKVAEKVRLRTAQSIFQRLSTLARWNFPLMILAYNIDDLILFSSLELITFKSSASASVSLIFNLIFLVLTVALIVAAVSIVKKSKANYTAVMPADKNLGGYADFDTKWGRYQVFYRGFRNNCITNQMFYVLYIVRIALPMLDAVMFSTKPLVVSILAVLVSMVMVVYVAVLKPFEKKISVAQILLIELAVLFMNLCVLVLTYCYVYNAGTYQIHSLLGDLIIVGNDFVNTLTLIFLIVRCVQKGRSIIRQATAKSSTSVEDKTALLQLVRVYMQQSSMGFEELIEDSSQSMEETKQKMSGDPAKSGRGDVKRTLMPNITNKNSDNSDAPEVEGSLY